jgi:hypothetical protein
LYYQLDTKQGGWTAATETNAAGSNPATYAFGLTGVPAGIHTLYAYATYGEETASVNGGFQGNGTLQIGNIAAYVFAEVSPAIASTTTLTSSLNPSVVGQSVAFTATLSPAPGPTGTVAFTSDGTTIDGCGAVALSASAVATCTTDSLPVGTDTIVATYSGDNTYIGSNATLEQVVTAPVTGSFTICARPSHEKVRAGSGAKYEVTVTSHDGFAGVVTLACSGEAQDGTCSFAQPNLTLAANRTARTTMTVTTTTADAGSPSDGGGRGYDKDHADGQDKGGRPCPTPSKEKYTITINGTSGAQSAAATVTLEVESK